ncbi:hypothetical protein JOB18_044402 [Solea senegalensis]|uniref:Uncharacterized protein n=1 Tax=Solea senegalensis TaxID=28829 RepID=A0AAV6R3D2_SOLSE|nr:hypothetical protein JOB18_044402 [Solea senegalensis]
MTSDVTRVHVTAEDAEDGHGERNKDVVTQFDPALIKAVQTRARGESAEERRRTGNRRQNRGQNRRQNRGQKQHLLSPRCYAHRSLSWFWFWFWS